MPRLGIQAFELQTLARERGRQGRKAKARAKPRSKSQTLSSPSSAVTPSGPLISLPAELQLMILCRLDLEAMVRLRQSCRTYRDIITVEVVKEHFICNGHHDAALQGCCFECLAMPGLDRLILDATRSSDLWRSICFRCWREKLTREYQSTHGNLLEFANNEYGYVCQFCAWPVRRASQPDSALQVFHLRCRTKRMLIAIFWFGFTIFQLGLGILAAVLAWTIYGHYPTVLIPTSIDFGLSVVAMIIFVIRICTVDEQKYSWALAMELMMTVVRIPPVCYTARETVISEQTQLGVLPKFALGIFLLNLIMRFFDTVGYALLYFGYDPKNVFLGDLSWRRKLLYTACTLVVWWACIPN